MQWGAQAESRTLGDMLLEPCVLVSPDGAFSGQGALCLAKRLLSLGSAVQGVPGARLCPTGQGPVLQQLEEGAYAALAV